jgi:hypothetical protein
MGTKQNPGPFDCYAAAAPDEPMFVLLARDPLAPALVREWARQRSESEGVTVKAREAYNCADGHGSMGGERQAPERLPRMQGDGRLALLQLQARDAANAHRRPGGMMTPPVTWDRATELRACVLCSHATVDLAGDRWCCCPAVTGREGRCVPIEKARALGGACGPEASHLTFPGLEPAGDRVRAAYQSVPRV